MKKITALLSSLLMVSAITPFSVSAADTQSTARLYFASDKNVISTEEAKAGIKVPVSVYVDDKSNDIQSLTDDADFHLMRETIETINKLER